MVDEGMAREVINRIQKLRKKCNLVPTDVITVYYRPPSEGDYLDTVIQTHTDFILATIKAPLKPYPVPPSDKVLIREVTQLKGSDLEITLTGGSAPPAALPTPACAYVNLSICINGKEQGGVLLLENPKGDRQLDLAKLKGAVSSIFDLRTPELALFHGKTEIVSKTDLLSLNGKTLCVTSGTPPAAVQSPPVLCSFLNLQLLNARPQECLVGQVGTLLLENPQGQKHLTYQGLLQEAARVFGLRSRRLRLFLNEAQTQEITEDVSMKSLNTQTVYVDVLPTTAEC
ncbi:isoleucine--tRNA ligase, cytoplasmic-like [Petaurus breviceps papuanus]|uniref:isoleucine--tRNA ligase, cytoplasmic-like n=1 Tax=Petaurus breviceps papuanus TaxID=3040969 RepID=UPI0036DA2785